MKKNKWICLLMAMFLVSAGVPFQYGFAEGIEPPKPLNYTSALNGTDDIRDLSKTNLDSNENIYIRFSTNIRVDSGSGIQPLAEKIHVYKVPVAEETQDATVFSYVYSQNEYVSIKPLKEIAIQEAKIVNQNTIEINPKEDLTALNQYRLYMDKGVIEDEMGNNLADNIDILFWTKTSLETQIPKLETNKTPVNNTPRYDLDTHPIVLYVDREVVPKASSQAFDIGTGKVYEGSLKNLNLIEAQESTKKANIEKCTLEYYIENNIKKTKISMYPAYRDPNNAGSYLKDKLDSGKEYQLQIPTGVFETRGGISLEPVNFNFIVAADDSQPKGIYYLENNKLKAVDLYNQDGLFSIKGYNFNNRIPKVDLKPHNAANPFVIGLTDIEFKDATKVDVHIRGKNRTALSNSNNAGNYEVIITFDDTPKTVLSSVYNSTYNGPDRDSKIYLHIDPKGKPKEKSKYPQSTNGYPWYDEKTLKHTSSDSAVSDKYFVRITFEDLDGKLDLSNIEDLRNCIIRPVSGTGNMVDMEFINNMINMSDVQRKTYIDKYIFVKGTKEATLYVPVKPLRQQTNYQIMIPAGTVYYTDTIEGNDPVEWSFTTTSTPYVKGITIGSIPEDYDEDEPLYLEGDFFYKDTLSVYFNDIKARSITVVNEHQLKVYLPDGRDRLEPGTYDIIVQNDANHKQTILGSLTVIKSGDEDNIPNEEYKVKEDGSAGEVRSNLKVSEDTLLLSPSDINARKLEIDLDEIMGEDVLTRKIQYEGDKKYNIGILETKSKWADITLYGVSVDNYAEDDEIIIRIGRVEPIVVQELKQKLRGRGVKSDFIQVTGENFKVNNVSLNIPIKYNGGKNVKVLKYDEDTRSFYEIQSTVNLVDRRVQLMSPGKGIFVVVQD